MTPVAIALIERSGHYLVRRRPPLPGSPMPGYWEFPGGKCHKAETPLACVQREILEEVGLPIHVRGLRRIVEHRYPHAHVLLHFFDCSLAGPDDQPAPSTGFVWVPVAELPRLAFPGGNAQIVEELVRTGAARPAP